MLPKQLKLNFSILVHRNCRIVTPRRCILRNQWCSIISGEI